MRKGTTLFVVERRVLEQVEAEFLGVELEGFVLVVNGNAGELDAFNHADRIRDSRT